MHFIINVARDGKHYFATGEGSLIHADDARAAYFDFQERFPASEGFKVEVIRWESHGTRERWKRTAGE